MIQHAARNHPLSISYIPKFNVRIFDGNTSQKIYDVTIQYDERYDNMERLKAINEVLEQIDGELKYNTIEKRLAMASIAMNNLCIYNQDGDGTAYHALIEGFADSQGISCAFKALCDHMDVECLVVSGQMEKQAYYWNIVKIEDSYYHMDISSLGTLGGEKSLFMKDTEKQVNCWWDQSEYPECDGELTYASAILFE